MGRMKWLLALGSTVVGIGAWLLARKPGNIRPSEGISNTPPATAGGTFYVASETGKVFHRQDCRFVQKIREDNRIIFATREAALAAGYQPSRECKP